MSKSNFHVTKFKLLVAKSKFGLTEEKCRRFFMCVVMLETCPMRAIMAAIVASRAATRQCEQIIKTYKVLFFPLVALSFDAPLSV